MKIIRDPSVYLVGKQKIDDRLAEFLVDVGAPNWTTEGTVDSEILVEVAARNCYQSWKKGRPHAEHLRHLLEVGHGSVTEHSVYSFAITGVSRSLLAELSRHRVGISLSVLSQRYVDESVAEYVEPDIIAADPELHAIWLDAVTHAHEAYVKLAGLLAEKSSTSQSLRLFEEYTPIQSPQSWLHAAILPEQGMFEAYVVWDGWSEAVVNLAKVTGADELTVRRIYGSDTKTTKVIRRSQVKTWRLTQEQKATATDRRKAARQAARSVLPNATETKIFLTANVRAIRHAIEQRCSQFADPEIRKLFGAVWEIMVVESPNLFNDYRKVPLPDGTFELNTEFRKV